MNFFMHEVTGHGGILGNELVDELAKNSLDLDRSYDNSFNCDNKECHDIRIFPLNKNFAKHIGGFVSSHVSRT